MQVNQVADDYPAIARRLKEIDVERQAIQERLRLPPDRPSVRKEPARPQQSHGSLDQTRRFR